MVRRHVLLDSLREKETSSGTLDDECTASRSTKRLPVDDLDLATKLLTAPLVPPLGFAMVTPGVYR